MSMTYNALEWSSMFWNALVGSREPEIWRKKALDNFDTDGQTDGHRFDFLELLSELKMYQGW